MKKHLFSLFLLLCAFSVFAQYQPKYDFLLTFSGTSHLYWPFESSRSNWSVTTASSAHKGGDLYAQDWNRYSSNQDCGEPVYAPFSGTVIFAGATASPCSYGNQVIIRSEYNNWFAFRVSHLESVSVTKDKFVKIGDKIGTLGNSGSGCGSVGEFSCHAHCVLHQGINNETVLNILKTGGFLSDTKYAAQFDFLARTPTPSPYLPYNGQTTGQFVNFDWYDVTNFANVEYRIQVSTSSSWTQENGFTSSTNCSVAIPVNKNTGSTSALTWGNTGTGICYLPYPNTTYYYTIKAYTPSGGSSYYTAKRSFKTQPIQLPDLIVTNPTAPSSAKRGSSITVSCYVKNTGTSTAGSSKVRYYLSSNSTYSSNDIALDYNSVSSLTAGSSIYKSESFSIPGSVSTGTWYLLFRADADGQVVESYETNNVSYKAINITSTLGDDYEPEISDSAPTGILARSGPGNEPNLAPSWTSTLYPNPVRSGNQLIAELEVTHSMEAGEVMLSIMDVAGRQLRTTSAEIPGEGRYPLIMDTGGLTTGIYFCRIHFGDKHEVVRFTVDERP